MADQTTRRFVEMADVSVVIVAVLCLFYSEIVFSGRTFITSGATAGVMGFPPSAGILAPRQDAYRVDLGASAWQMEPWTREVGQSYATGTFPLWNAHQGFGAPLLAEPVAGALDPLRLPMWVSASAAAWDFYFLVRAILGLAATYLFARVVGLSLTAGLFLAIGYVFSGHFIAYGNMTWVEGYYLFPLLLLGTECIIIGRRRTGFLLTATSTALIITMGMPEASLVILCAAALYGAYRNMQPIFAGRAPQGHWTQVALWAGSWVSGVALAAPQLLPLAEYAKNSAGLVDQRQKFGLGYEAVRHFGVLFIPHVEGLNAEAAQMGASLGTYVGATVLVLALHSFSLPRGTLWRRLVPSAITGAALLSAKIFGLPLINDLGRLPGFDITQFPRSAGPILCFFLVVLAGVSVHYLGTGTDQVHKQSARSILVLLAGAWTVLLCGVTVDWQVIKGVRPSWEFAHIGFSLALSAAVSALIYARGRWLQPRSIGTALCAMVIFELFVYAPYGAYQDRRDPYRVPPYVAFLQNQARVNGPYRIFGLNGIMFPNIAGVFGLDDIRSLDPLDIDRYMLYVRTFLAPGVADRYVGGPWFSPESSTRLQGNPWFDLTGVRYVLEPAGFLGIRAGHPRPSSFVPSSTPHSSSSTGTVRAQYIRVYNAEIQIFRNRYAFPRAFLVSHILASGDERSTLMAMTSGTVDPARTAVVEGVKTGQMSLAGPSNGQVRVVSDGAQGATIHVRTNRASFLVLTDAFYPGWQATVDGLRVPIWATDLAFRGIFVPGGRHVVEFTYRPESYTLGLVAALTAVIAILLVLLRPWTFIRPSSAHQTLA